jgi:hypothetical protein
MRRSGRFKKAKRSAGTKSRAQSKRRKMRTRSGSQRTSRYRYRALTLPVWDDVNLLMEGKQVEDGSPLKQGYMTIKIQPNGSRHREMYGEQSYIMFAKEGDIVYAQKGTHPRNWRPIYPEFTFSGHPFYVLQPTDNVEETVKAQTFDYSNHIERGTIGLLWPSKIQLEDDEIRQLQYEMRTGNREQFRWNSHGIWKKEGEQYFTVLLYNRSSQPLALPPHTF